jgi:P-type Cu+ transporter
MKNCASTVQNALRAVRGVTKAEVSFEEKRARVWGTATPEELIEAVDTVGFGATLG